MIKGLEIPYGIKTTKPTLVDAWSGPFTSVSDANSQIPTGVRLQSKLVNIIDNGVAKIYWYKNGITDNDLVQFDQSDYSYIQYPTGSTRIDTTVDKVLVHGESKFDNKVTIEGDLVINGALYAQQPGVNIFTDELRVTENIIYTRNGATAGLPNGEYTGIQFINYDGSNTGGLLVDNQGWGYLGDLNSMSKIATIQNNPTNNKFLRYNSTSYNIETSDILSSEVGFTPVGTLTETTAYGALTQLDTLKVPYTLFSRARKMTGWLFGNDINISYSYANRTITITGDLSYLFTGIERTLTSSWTSTAHPNTIGPWFLSSTDGINFTWSQTKWPFKDLMIAFVNRTNSIDTSFAIRETHGLMDEEGHEESHDNIGTYRVYGGNPTAGSYILNNASDSANSPSFDTALLKDEDVTTLVNQWIKGTYTTMYVNGTANTSTFNVASTLPFIGATNDFIQVNDVTVGTLITGIHNRYYNVYQIMMPATSDAGSQKFRHIMVQPQKAFTSLEAAQSEDVRTVNLGGLSNLSPEFNIYTRLTYITQNANSNTGKCSLSGISYVIGTRANQLNLSGFTANDHRALSYLNWTESGHIGTANRFTRFDTNGVASEYDLFGSENTFTNYTVIKATPNPIRTALKIQNATNSYDTHLIGTYANGEAYLGLNNELNQTRITIRANGLSQFNGGNVAINSSSDTGDKLQVNGDIYSTGSYKLKGTGTGITTIATANASANNYTATLQAATGTLAYLTDNVASATKLQTARTIAGVAFDGTANISISFAGISSTPTTLAGYGIINGVPYSGAVAHVALGNFDIGARIGSFTLSQSVGTTTDGISSNYGNYMTIGTSRTTNGSAYIVFQAVQGTPGSATIHVTDGGGVIDKGTMDLRANLLLHNGTPISLSSHNHNDTYLGIAANAVSATKLQTARTIAGVAFDGTANISLASSELSDSSNIAKLNANQSFTGSNTFTNQITSTVATGTAPFSIASTTEVGNLTVSAARRTFTRNIQDAHINQGLDGIYAFRTTTGASNYPLTQTGGGIRYERTGSDSLNDFIIYRDALTSSNTDLYLHLRSSTSVWDANWYKFYHSGNSNLPTIDWTCSTLTATSIISTNLTDGYIPYHVSDVSGLANSAIFQSGTNVGIATTTPAAKLTINTVGGAANVTGATTESVAALSLQSVTGLGTSTKLMFGIGSSAYTWLQAQNVSNNNVIQLALNPLGGFIGIGTTAPQRLLHLASTTPNIRLEDSTNGIYSEIIADTAQGLLTINADVTSSGTGPQLVRLVGGSTTALDTGSNGTRIYGKVGIGQPIGTEQLEVTGNGVFTGFVNIGTTNITKYSGAAIQQTSTTSTFDIDANQILRLGRTTNYATFSVDILKGDNTTSINHRLSGSNNSYLSVSSGNVGIGYSTATALTEKLEVSGNIKATGTLAATSFNSITGLASVAPLAPAVAAVVGTSTLVARQDHVHPANFTATATDIKMNGTQAVGTATTFPRADHVHPVDTSRAAVEQTFFLGTTSVAINRVSASIALTGITSIDGNAATATNADTVDNKHATAFYNYKVAATGIPSTTGAGNVDFSNATDYLSLTAFTGNVTWTLTNVSTNVDKVMAVDCKSGTYSVTLAGTGLTFEGDVNASKVVQGLDTTGKSNLITFWAITDTRIWVKVLKSQA